MLYICHAFFQGITPARDYLNRILKYGFAGNKRAAAKRVPTLLWCLPPEVSSTQMSPPDAWEESRSFLDTDVRLGAGRASS